jgi:hypothetical protein
MINIVKGQQVMLKEVNFKVILRVGFTFKLVDLKVEKLLFLYIGFIFYGQW